MKVWLLCFLSGKDFDAKFIDSLTFAPGVVDKTTDIAVKCDSDIESEEKFNISLLLTSNNTQVRTGRDRAEGVITDSTGKWWDSSEYRRWYDRINCTVVVNFKQSSYEVIEDSNEVMIVIELSQPSSEPFEVMISLMNVTAQGE